MLRRTHVPGLARQEPARRRSGAYRSGSRVRRYVLPILGLVSLLLHGLIAGAFLLAHRDAPAPVAIAPDKPVTVQLVMEEQQGSGPPQAAPPPHPPDQAQPQPHPQTPPEATPPPPPDPKPTTEGLPPAAQPAPPNPPDPLAAAQPAATPAPPQPPLQINIGGTDSPSNAIVEGHDVIPGSPDNPARNRPPAYPEAAARQGQYGTVSVVVHVGTAGVADGVDIERSSGYPLLDRAAEEAVRKWTFAPATKDGLPVPFDFRMNFKFAFQ